MEYGSTGDFKDFAEKTDIEKIMFADQYKFNQESLYYLGVSKSDLIKIYSIEELRKRKTYEKIENDMINPQIGEVLIRGELFSDYIIKIVRIAQKNNIRFRIINDSDLKGDAGLALIKGQSRKKDNLIQ